MRRVDRVEVQYCDETGSLPRSGFPTMIPTGPTPRRLLLISFPVAFLILLASLRAEPTPERHWAFEPISNPPIPASSEATSAIDAFIHAAQARHGLRTAPSASRRVLIRRLSLDLLGLPPTLDEIRAFEQDTRPEAYERLVERLLASPHHGERWGRHWLDVARWAESEGYESNHPRPFAWRYRDYVVASFNADKPFDQFLTQQLAGDELTPYSDENLIATGFLAAARLSSNEEDKYLQRNQVLVDVVNATGSAFLGLTLSCAQCHNHKFDPLGIREYYSFMAYFLPGQPVNVELRDPLLRKEYERIRPATYPADLKAREATFERARQALIAARTQELTAEQRRVLDIPLERRSPEEEALARQAQLQFQAGTGEIEKFIPSDERAEYDARKKRIATAEKVAIPPQTWAYYSPVTSPHRLEVLASVGFYPLPYEPKQLARLRSYVHLRGDVHAVGATVQAGVPAIFQGVALPSDRPGSRRTLARWLTDPRHPLTARVWANRVWQYHFGKGLVGTADDFGTQGERPTHPELLDWLAGELIRSGWSTRHLHRLIVQSQTYRQSAQVGSEARQRDPENRHLTRWPIHRLESEAIRDVMLAITGELDRRVGGPSIPVEQADQSTRRGLYLTHRRGRPAEMQRLFDGPDEAAESCPRRHSSTTALQALYLLNHPFTLARAQKLASLLPAEPRAQVLECFQRVLGRAPDDEELAWAEHFLAAAEDRKEGLVRFCHTILNLNEAITIE